MVMGPTPPGTAGARSCAHRRARQPVLIDIEGVLRLDGDFPDRAPMLQIAQYNTARALAFLR
jgi:hypothetical protein